MGNTQSKCLKPDDIGLVDGLVNLLNAVYGVRHKGGGGFKLINKTTKEETAINTDNDLLDHLNSFYGWNDGIYSIENGSLVFVEASSEETTPLAYYNDDMKIWVKY
jgi:hypothetical protein